jgi:hypothetical protein
MFFAHIFRDEAIAATQLGIAKIAAGLAGAAV